MKQMIRLALDHLPYVGGLHTKMRNEGAYAAGHYYSPLPNDNEIQAAIRATNPKEAVLSESICGTPSNLCFSMSSRSSIRSCPSPRSRISAAVTSSTKVGSCTRFRPRPIVEVGSGFSSTVMLDTVEQFIPGEVKLTFIEPYPGRLKELLRGQDKTRNQILESRVQGVHRSVSSSLEAGELLFIDCITLMHKDEVGQNLPKSLNNPGESLYVRRV